MLLAKKRSMAFQKRKKEEKHSLYCSHLYAFKQIISGLECSFPFISWFDAYMMIVTLKIIKLDSMLNMSSNCRIGSQHIALFLLVAPPLTHIRQLPTLLDVNNARMTWTRSLCHKPLLGQLFNLRVDCNIVTSVRLILLCGKFGRQALGTRSIW